jgi:hypothetical protein
MPWCQPAACNNCCCQPLQYSCHCHSATCLRLPALLPIYLLGQAALVSFSHAVLWYVPSLFMSAFCATVVMHYNNVDDIKLWWRRVDKRRDGGCLQTDNKSLYAFPSFFYFPTWFILIFFCYI